MLRNLIVCGFALAALLVLTADASAFGGKRKSGCGNSCGSSYGASCGSSCYAPAPAPVYYAPPPPPAPAPAPYYGCQQPTYYASSCGSSCGHGHRGGCGGHRRGCR
jgi:hypothetical protein